MPHRGRNLYGLLTIVLVVRSAQTLKLAPPRTVFVGDTFSVSWTTSSRDPALFDLSVSCGLVPGFQLASGIDINSSPGTYGIPTDNPEPFTRRQDCILLAIRSDNLRLLTSSNPFRVIPKDFSSSSSTLSSTGTEIPAGSSSTKISISLSVPESGIITATTELATQLRSSATLPPTRLGTPTTNQSSMLRTSIIDLPRTSTSSSTDVSHGQSPTNPVNAPYKDHATRAIIGAVTGACTFLALLVAAFMTCRRKRRIHATVVPLTHDRDYVQPLEKNERLAQIFDERAAAERQHTQLLLSVVEVSSADDSGTTPSRTADTSSEDLVGAMRQQLECWRQRIRELETQQHELEDQLYGPQAPPYSPIQPPT